MIDSGLVDISLSTDLTEKFKEKMAADTDIKSEPTARSTILI
jgi:hypothetical protein